MRPINYYGRRNLKRLLAPRRVTSSSHIVSDELEKLIQGEIMSGLQEIFREREEEQAPRRHHSFMEDDEPFSPRGTNSLPDRRQMESLIDQMVASSLVNGRQTSGVLRVLFGLVPSLIGR